jgi:hypothetical protein
MIDNFSFLNKRKMMDLFRFKISTRVKIFHKNVDITYDTIMIVLYMVRYY